MTNLNNRQQQYEICQERGHTPSGRVQTSNPPWNVCKWCETSFRYEQKLIERNVPDKEK